jgi:hypothetical protein
MIEINGQQKYEVDESFDSKTLNHQLQYFNHWQGYDVNEHTWEPFKHLWNVMEKVKEFHH